MKPLVAFLVILTVAAPALSQSTGDSQAKPQAKRYWLDPEYQRWLVKYERERDALEQARALDIVGVKPGMTVGEVGAGNGYFALKIAARVGPTGTVYANDIVENFLAELRERATERGFSNIKTVLGTKTDPRLPAGTMDFVFMVQVFWHLSDPVEILDGIAASLKPGAKLVLVEQEDGTISHEGRVVQEHTREIILNVVSRSRFRVERIDTSLPAPAWAVVVLALK
jgi:ubiquinone/menaquinone biosynthesis C-methylase UbiE